MLHPRLFHKSTSEQYRFARGLTSAQRGELEEALHARVRHSPEDAERRAALAMWMSVQQARLRAHDAAHREWQERARYDALTMGLCIVTLPLVPMWLWTLRRNYYESPIRAEYAEAFDNFMRMLIDPEVPRELRETVAERLRYHLRSEGTIAPRQAELLRAQGAMQLAESGYLVSEDSEPPVFNLGERHVLWLRGRSAASGQERAPGPPPPGELLADAVGSLTGTHPDDLDLSGLTAGRTQEVVDHLHDLGDSTARPCPQARRALREARGDVEQLVRRLLTLVGEGVSSERTLDRARRGRQDRARRAAARPANPQRPPEE